MTGKKLKANEMFQDILSLWPTHLSTPPHMAHLLEKMASGRDPEWLQLE